MSSDVVISMSQTVGKIGAALARAQLEMRPALKDSVNPAFKQGGQTSKYASLASCVEALRPLHANEIAVIQPPAIHGPDGVCVSTLLIHSSGEWIRGDLYMPAAKRDPQGFGSALTYARRYCLSSTVGLATDDDDGEAAQRSSDRNGAGGGQQGPSARGERSANPSPRADGSSQGRRFESDKATVESLLLRIDSAKSPRDIGAIAGDTKAAYSAKKLSDEDYSLIASRSRARSEGLNGHGSDRHMSRAAGED
jgi:hypothetical protein